MTWRTKLLVQQPPTAAAVFTFKAPNNVYTSVAVADGVVVHTEAGVDPHAVDAATMIWLQQLGAVHSGPREVSRVRCGRDGAGALVLYHLRDVIVLTPAQMTTLSQAIPATLTITLHDLQGLNGVYQAILAGWLGDDTIDWSAIVADATHVLGTAGIYMPSSF